MSLIVLLHVAVAIHQASCVMLPHTVETDDTRRLRKRMNGYRAVLSTSEYASVRRAYEEGQILRMPPEPDPRDLTIPKRKWEAAIQQWRRSLRTLASMYQHFS